MKQYLKFYGRYALMMMLYFGCARALFLLFRHQHFAEFSLADVAGCIVHGAHIDASFSGYLLLLLAVLIAIVAPFGATAARRTVATITIALLVLTGMLTVVDAELFEHWGFRLDDSPLPYLTHPREAIFGSLSLWRTAMLLLLAAAWVTAWVWAFTKVVLSAFPRKRLRWTYSPVFILIAGLCIIPIRGSFNTAPMNHGMVFFSKNPIINQATLNMPWNLMHSLLHRKKIKFYRFMPPEEARREAKPYLDPPPQADVVRVVETSRPNVIIVLLESMAAQLVGCVGGEQGLTPCFDSLAAQGLLFTHIYASGHRTERGLVAALSGYPSQTGMPVISINSKMKRLPCLAEDFAGEGYSTAFFYGGDISFVNTRSYVLQNGFDLYTSRSDFPRAQQSSKWGVHDEFLYARTLATIDNMPQPFFAALLTLSNHEPYHVPMQPVISGTDDDAMRNAVCYADRCLGEFVAQCRQRPWWGSTLVALIADHGKVVNPLFVRYDTATIRIPMLWIGGALGDNAAVVNRIGAQHDLPGTLLPQLGMKSERYRFSKNILDRAQLPFAMHIFNDGFTFVSDSATFTYGNAEGKLLLYSCDSAMLRRGQAIFQEYNEDLRQL